MNAGNSRWRRWECGPGPGESWKSWSVASQPVMKRTAPREDGEVRPATVSQEIWKVTCKKSERQECAELAARRERKNIDIEGRCGFKSPPCPFEPCFSYL